MPEPGGRDGFAGRHDGLDPAGVWLLPTWLRVVDVLARPLHRVPPDVISLAAVAAAGAALRVCGPHPVAAAALAGASGVLDALDGAVATASGRVSAHGRALDSACDRAGEGLLLAALVRGAALPVGGAAGTVGVTAALELHRRRAGTHVRLTTWERPSRVVLAVVGLVAAADRPRRERHGRTTAVVGLALAGTGLAQLGRATRVSGAGRGPSSAAHPGGGGGGSPA